MSNDYFDNSDPGQRFQPGEVARAGDVEAKFDAVQAGFEGVQVDTRRSLKIPAGGASQEITDDPLVRANRVVGFDAEGNVTLTQGFTWREDWAAAVEYFVNDCFRDPATKNIYVARVRHISTSIAADIAAGRIGLAVNVVDVETIKGEAVAAQQGAEAARDAAAQRRDEAQAARNKSQQWAEGVGEVEPGAYSALHHRQGAAQAQGLSEEARDASIIARNASQQARDESQLARNQAELHRNSAGNFRDEAQAARNKAQQWAEAEAEVEPGQRSSKYWAGKAQEVVDEAKDDLGLGTAAFADLTESPTDSTPGSVLTVGDGGVLRPVILVNQSFNDLPNVNMLSYASSMDDGPKPSNGWLLHEGLDADHFWQTYKLVSEDRMFFRRKLGGLLQPWREMYHTGNLDISNFATKDDIGDIGTILDAINGEAP